MADDIGDERGNLDEEMSNGGEEKPEVRRNPSSSESDSESDDEEAEENLHLQTLENELAGNPSNYEAHVNYIKLLRKLGEIDKLRQARESMSAIFPLSPSMWQEWAKDEASLCAGSEEFAAIEKLYERGVRDYMSVSLWCDYLNFAQEHDPVVRECSPVGMSKMRNLFECALTATGLHVTEGSRIWEAYIEFEQAIFHAIDDRQSEEKEKQVQRIRSIFHRQLSVPLADSSSVLLAYKAWEVEQGNIHEVNSEFDGIPSHVTIAYKKAIEMYNARANYEEQISNRGAPDAERLQHFMTYLQFEESSGDPARVQILYERAVTEFPISSDLWLNYTHYLDQTLKVPKIVMDAYCRATRNCPWVKELWVGYLLSLERARASEKELSAVFEEALQCSFSNFEEYLDLFLTRIDGLRRQISWSISTEDGLDYVVIRDTFQRAADYLSSNFKNSPGLLHLYSYWARLEFDLAKDLIAARGVWESLLKKSGSMLEAWQQYIEMEIGMGHLVEARSLYKRCYSKRFSGTGSEDICHGWLRFEREFGTLEDYDHAKRKVTPRLKELQLFRLEQESISISTEVGSKVDLAKKSSQKRKAGGAPIYEVPTPKRQKGMAQDCVVLEKDTSQRSKEETIIDSIEPKSDIGESTREQHIKHSISKETYTDQCTLFISNLNFQAKDEHLRDFFSDVGGVTAIRLLRDKFTGKSRGLAYVDFVDDAHLAAAVGKNKQMLLGKKISIARSDPRRNKKGGASERSKHEHGRRTGTQNESGDAINTSAAQKEESSKASVSSLPRTSTSRRQGVDVELKGKNTFAMPRNLVRPLGWSDNTAKNEQDADSPKSNEEFRKMLLKK